MGAPKGHKSYIKKGEGGAPEIYTHDFIEKEAIALLKWIEKDDNYYYNRFALERGYSRQRFVEFAEKSKIFSDALTKARESQEQKLVEKGLSNTHNANLTKFVLTNCHNWREHLNQTLSGDAANPLGFVLSTIDGASKELVHEEE